MSADEDGRGNNESKVSLRARLSDFKQRLQSPVVSREDLYELLLAPLDLLGIVPTDLPAHLVKYAVWKDCNEEDRQKIHTAHAWISDVQKVLIEEVMVDWNEEIQKMPWLLEAWFAPVSRTIEAEGSKLTANAGTMYIASLSTFTAILSAASLNHGSSASSSTPLAIALPAVSISLLERVLVLFCKGLSLKGVIESLQTYHTKTKRDIIWTTVIRELASLPERVANGWSGKGPLELERRHFVKTLAIQLEDLLHSQCPPDLTAGFLAKLLRSGYFEETTSDQEEPANIWPTFLRGYISRDLQSVGTWSEAMQLLPSSSQNGITQSLLSFVDRYSLRRGLSCFLLNGDEQIRPGTEGQGFLQAEAWNSVLTMAATIEPLLISKSSSKVRESNEEDSDSDEDESNTSLLEKSILPSSSGYWSPLMARLLLHIYCRQASEKQLSNTLSKAVELWSAPTRIKTALWQQEVYLTTVILLLVAQLPTASTSALCTSAAFISGVSVHLEHLSPQVRRMGMLVAEIVSTASGGKALSFGRSIWDGKGEGKEEARVLRAMYHGWGSREKVTVKVDEQAKLSAFGLSNTLEVATRQASVSVREERKAPKTRSLPAKTAAPSRMKPLIQSLDGDDSLQDNTLQDESLPSLTNLQSIRGTSSSIQPLPYSSDGEISSSSESNSSDSDIEGGNIPQIPVEKKEEFGLGMPQKKKRRAPIYIHELAPLFREQEREANKLALKHAEPLIKKKTGWGGEIDENAINLALAIISLQNNFSFKLFEEKKKEILTALVVASPRLVAPCLAEAYFNQQYSMTQRVCILNSLAFGARQISITGKQGDETNLKTLAEGFSHMAIVRSRVEGERRLPQGRPEDKSVLLQQSAPKSLDAGNGVSRSKVTKKGNVYLELAGPSFIFPLVNRFWSHLDHANMTRSSRYRGSGSTILFDPFLIGAFLDTLAILCYCAQNAINFSSDIVPEVISLTLTMTNSALARISQGEDSQGGGPLSILGAAANLFLLLMDAVCEVDDGRTLMHRHRNLIQQVETWAQAVFESAEASGNIDRAGRCSAALLVRVNEMKLARQ